MPIKIGQTKKHASQNQARDETASYRRNSNSPFKTQQDSNRPITIQYYVAGALYYDLRNELSSPLSVETVMCVLCHSRMCCYCWEALHVLYVLTRVIARGRLFGHVTVVDTWWQCSYLVAGRYTIICYYSGYYYPCISSPLLIICSLIIKSIINCRCLIISIIIK